MIRARNMSIWIVDMKDKLRDKKNENNNNKRN